MERHQISTSSNNSITLYSAEVIWKSFLVCGAIFLRCDPTLYAYSIFFSLPLVGEDDGKLTKVCYGMFYAFNGQYLCRKRDEQKNNQ